MVRLVRYDYVVGKVIFTTDFNWLVYALLGRHVLGHGRRWLNLIFAIEALCENLDYQIDPFFCEEAGLKARQRCKEVHVECEEVDPDRC